MESHTYQITLTGRVQSVGFRPFIYRLARDLGIRGGILNTTSGVEIRALTSRPILNLFLEKIRKNPPPLARIESINLKKTRSQKSDDTEFQIFESKPGLSTQITLSPDIRICEDCKRELLNPQDRRYFYPFINCINCGPRFTIIKGTPYDRPQTTMAPFKMCPECRQEFKNPLNRRFHAQPNACHACGPKLSLEILGRKPVSGQGALATRQLLRKAMALVIRGEILAAKSLGGYHLLCDALNQKAVERLRTLKLRDQKPFALMADSLKSIEMHCRLNASQRELLSSPESPIVLLPIRAGNRIPTERIAPHKNELGFMLPYTPLHLLMFETLKELGVPHPILVMTSGNLSDEPITYQDNEARKKLSPLTRNFLTNDRVIHMRCDDSVVRFQGNAPFFLRKSRGYTPDVFPLAKPLKHSILALGADLKNTFSLGSGKRLITSHYIGDLDDPETFDSFKEALNHYTRLFRIKPDLVVCDLHPAYHSSRFARIRFKNNHIETQHHWSHLVSCMLDNRLDGEVIGVIFDGTGYGTDGHLWGSEFLIGSAKSFIRAAHFNYLQFYDGEKSVLEPYRNVLRFLNDQGLNPHDFPFYQSFRKMFRDSETRLFAAQALPPQSPFQSSGMGRLFDFVSVLCGFDFVNRFEGHLPSLLETHAARSPTKAPYSYTLLLKDKIPVVDTQALLLEILKDSQKGRPPAAIASRFHSTIAAITLDLVQRIKKETGINRVVLSGGSFQNKILLTSIYKLLEKSGIKVYRHERIPANDQGISPGQLLIAAEHNKS